MPTMLNDDCWNTILFFLKYDFRTLSRLMCVSHQFLNLAAPVLYGRLGHPQSKKLIEGWSINKRKKLSTLLLTSSGFLNSTPTAMTPLLFIDYFGLLTWLPSHLVEPEIWERLMEADDNQTEHADINQNYNQSTSTARHATVLTEIRMSELTQIEKWLPHAEKFAKLEELVISFEKPYPEGAKERIFEFVNRHGAVFPGQLKEIRSGNGGSAQMAMELSMLWKNPERFQFWLGDEVMESLQEQVKNDGYNNIDKEIAMDTYLTPLFSSIKKLDVIETKETVQNGGGTTSYSVLSKALQYCKQLEQIVLFGALMYQEGPKLGRVFTWSSQEPEQATVAQAVIGIDQDQQQPGTLRQLTTKHARMTTVVPLKSFTGRNITPSVLVDVMNGFRYSLEQIEFTPYFRVPGPVCVSWTWSLPNLRMLRLDDCYLAFCKLEEFCPNLEVLLLTGVMSLEASWHHLQANHDVNNIHFDFDQEVPGLIKKYWRAMQSLKVLRFRFSSDSSTLELGSIGNLRRLEDLRFEGERWAEVDGRNLLRQLECVQLLHWDLSNLRCLTLVHPTEPDWSRLLLRSAPNLEYLSAPAEVFFSIQDDEGFWTETRLDTLNRVAEFEARVNKWNEPGNEHLLERQEEVLSREKLLDTYRTAEGGDIWNAHSSKVRSMIFCGNAWSKSHVRKLKLMFDSGHEVQTEANIDLSDSNNNNNNESNDDHSQDNSGYHDGNHNHVKLYDQVCFPCLRYVNFNGSIDGIENEDMDKLIKSAMRHRGMRRVEARFSQLTTVFLESLQELDKDDFTETWESEVTGQGGDDIGYDGPCVLNALGSKARFYCLRSNA